MLLLVSVSCPMTLNKNKHMISLLFYYIYWLFLLCFLLVLFHVVVLLMSQSNFQLFIFGWSVWCSLGVVMSVLCCKCCGDATIFLPWVLHFWGCGFATGGVILGVGNNLN